MMVSLKINTSYKLMFKKTIITLYFLSFSAVVRFRTCDLEFPGSNPGRCIFFFFLLYIFYIKKSDFCFFSFLQGSSIKRQKAKEYIEYVTFEMIIYLY